MDEVLVENAQHDVDRDQGRQDQEGLGGQRVLEGLRGSLEAAVDRGRHANLQLGML